LLDLPLDRFQKITCMVKVETAKEQVSTFAKIIKVVEELSMLLDAHIVK